MSQVYGSVTLIMVSGLDDWIYGHLLVQSLLITINYSTITNLPSSQITGTCFVLVLHCTPSILILVLPLTSDL
jgi:hypothetical protein